MSKLQTIAAIVLVVFTLLALGVFTVLANVPGVGVGEMLAQGVPTVAETSGPVTTEQGRLLVEGVINTSLIGGVATGAGVLFIVQILKFIPIAWLQKRSATDMATGVATIILIVGAIFSETSYAGTFDNSVAFMENVAPLIGGLLTAVASSSVFFNGAKRLGASEQSLLGKRLTGN